MVREAKKVGIVDMYTENLCFAPSYRTAKEIVDKGGLGRVYLCKAYESDDIVLGSKAEKEVMKSAWYLDPAQSGGGKLDRAPVFMRWSSSALCSITRKLPGARRDH